MKKVLIITYYWPPAGGPGVQRWLKFVKYLRNFDIKPVVYIPENPDYPIIDKSFLQEIPEDIEVLKQPIFEPYRLASLLSNKKTKKLSSGIINETKQTFSEKLLLWIRGNFFIPDARKFWVKPSVRFLSSYIKNKDINLIITTGPPHSVHLIGLALKKRMGIKWLSDFRDPWTTIGYHRQLKLHRFSRQKHLKLEKKVLNNADQILVTSKKTKEEFALKTEQPIHVITNGFESYPLEEETKPILDKKFTLAHIGSLLSARNPLVLWEVLSELITEDPVFAADLSINLAGVLSEQVLASIETYHLKPYVTLSGYIPHHEALVMQRSSQLLLLIEINEVHTQCILPGKLFEYMAAKRPILAIGPENWDAFEILNQTKSGSGFTYAEKAALKEKITSYYTDFKSGKLEVNTEGLDTFSRKNLTARLASLIHKM